MRARNWFFAAFGLVLTGAGGVAEARHDVMLGALSVVVGLATWVLFSGSSFHIQALPIDTDDENRDVGEILRPGSQPSQPDAPSAGQ